MIATIRSRPGRDEAAAYYFKYIDRVPDGDVVDLIEAQEDETLSQLATVGEEKSRQAYAPGKWTWRQVLGHVNDAERLFQARAFWFARGFDTPLPSFDQEVCAASAQADDVAWAAHLDEFRAVRSASVCLFRNLPAAAWVRRGVASDCSFTVRALAYLVAGHVIHHVGVLKERYR